MQKMDPCNLVLAAVDAQFLQRQHKPPPSLLTPQIAEMQMGIGADTVHLYNSRHLKACLIDRLSY